jgi:hypothetical protein
MPQALHRERCSTFSRASVLPWTAHRSIDMGQGRGDPWFDETRDDCASS